MFEKRANISYLWFDFYEKLRCLGILDICHRVKKKNESYNLARTFF